MADGVVSPCPQCAPPPADAIAVLNSTEVRAVTREASASSNGVGGEGVAGGDGGEGQKVTPWEVEVRGCRGWRMVWVYLFVGLVG